MTMTTATNRAMQRFIDVSTEKALQLHKAGYGVQAIAIYRDVLEVMPDNDEVLFQLAIMYRNIGRPEEALPLLRVIHKQSPFYAGALFAQGMILVNRGNFAGGADCFTRLVELDDKHIDGHNNLAICLLEIGPLEEACRHFQRAVQLAPDNAEIHNNLGNFFARGWKLTEAREQYQRAIALKADYAGAYCNLARVANFEGCFSDAVALFRTALELRPSFRTAADNLLFILNNTDTYTPEQIRDEHLRLAHVYGGSAVACSVSHQQRPGERIRIGYVSADFRDHSVGFFIEPVLNSHDKGNVDIFCYDQSPKQDETKNRIMKIGWTWRTVYGLSDSDVAAMIRADGVDILVDLSGHSEGNRLGVFALKPAPVQVTWLGYPNTTGLKQIDYRLTDDLADPPGMTDHLYSEHLVRLPRTFLCYTPSLSAPEVASLPEGPVIFCSFNNYAKVSDTVLKLWARVLHHVSDSRLFLKSRPLGDPAVRAQLIRRFAELGIDPSRLIIEGYTVGREGHLQCYGACHIALDTYPYNGTTTTCESLWMGVPVVTLAGRTHVSRVGASVLGSVGLSDLVALNPDQYVDIAISLANKLPRLQEYRHSLRARLFRSPMMDAASFTFELEQVYRRMVFGQSGE